ncbi:MAG: CapA family protein [Ignavibacteriales bacterium]|nr:CapA family protein [Ignavibacteriales bacterium]
MKFRAWLILLVCFSAGSFAQGKDSTAQVKVLLFGDVNLGRTVGQELLKGNLDFPFKFVKDSLDKADIIFVNLESQLSEQGGETQHPQYNLIFCGPPVGAKVLKQANISVVSTANNHAYDYGIKGLRETIGSLKGEGINGAGTSEDSVSSFSPAIVERNGVRVGFLAYTQFVNLKGKWDGRISLYDFERAQREIADIHSKVDFVIASYHGGVEYVDKPNKATLRQLQGLADAGADIVVGHHPHYPQGVERYNNKLIFYSLGNFVFSQPQYQWTQKAFGVELVLKKQPDGVILDSVRLIPLKAGLQPSFVRSDDEKKNIVERIKKLSNIQIHEINSSYFIQINK